MATAVARALVQTVVTMVAAVARALVQTVAAMVAELELGLLLPRLSPARPSLVPLGTLSPGLHRG